MHMLPKIIIFSAELVDMYMLSTTDPVRIFLQVSVRTILGFGLQSGTWDNFYV